MTLLEESVPDTPQQNDPPSFEECMANQPGHATATALEEPEKPQAGDTNLATTTYENLSEVFASEGYGGANGIQPYARTKYKFNSQYPNELSFDVGQIVHLIRHIDDEWMEGQLEGKIGLFPTEYVDIIVDVAHDLPKIAGTIARATYDFESDVPGDLLLKVGPKLLPSIDSSNTCLKLGPKLSTLRGKRIS